MPLLKTKERRHQLLSSASKLLHAGLDTNEKRSEYKKLIADADAIEADIIMQEKIERNLPKIEPTPAFRPTAVQNTESSPEERRKRLNAAFRSLLKNGHNIQYPEQRAITIASDGTAVIPQEYEISFAQALKTFGPIATLVKRADEPNGRPRKFVVSDDTSSTMTYLVESGATSGIEADPTLDSKIPGTDALVTIVKYSLQELDDAANLDAFLRDIAGLRVARAVEHVLTLGTDNGSNTQMPNSPTGGLLASVSTGCHTVIGPTCSRSDLRAVGRPRWKCRRRR